MSINTINITVLVKIVLVSGYGQVKEIDLQYTSHLQQSSNSLVKLSHNYQIGLLKI